MGQKSLHCPGTKRQRDRSPFIVPEEGTTGQAQNLVVRDSPGRDFDILPRDRPGQDFDILSRPVPGQDSGQKEKKR